MSGTENEAVEAGTAAIRACMHDPSNDARPQDLAQAAYDAMREIIAREAIAAYNAEVFRKLALAFEGKVEAVPAPEPCPFDGCDTGPLGRDQLIAHIAECPEAKVMQGRINDLKRRIDEHDAYYEDSRREIFGDYPRSEQ